MTGIARRRGSDDSTYKADRRNTACSPAHPRSWPILDGPLTCRHGENHPASDESSECTGTAPCGPLRLHCLPRRHSFIARQQAGLVKGARTSRQSPADLSGTSSGGTFVVSRAGEGYDAQTRDPNRIFWTRPPDHSFRQDKFLLRLPFPLLLHTLLARTILRPDTRISRQNMVGDSSPARSVGVRGGPSWGAPVLHLCLAF